MTPRSRAAAIDSFTVAERAADQGVSPEVIECAAVQVHEIEALGDALGVPFGTSLATDPWEIVGWARLDRGGRLTLTSLHLRPRPLWQAPSGHPALERAGEIGAPAGTGRSVEQGPYDTYAGGITSDLLRAVKLGPLLQGLRRALQQHPDMLARRERYAETVGDESLRPAPGEPQMALLAAADAAVEVPRRGRRGYGDAFYRTVARQYLRLQEAGWRRGILNELARINDRPRDTVNTWVQEATRRGFLTPGTPGRAGRDPGPNLDPTKGKK